MAQQQRSEQMVRQASTRERTPWTLRVASWAWTIAGTLLMVAPLLATLLLWLQYRSLRKNAMRLTDLVGSFTPSDVIDLDSYIVALERFEDWMANTSGWLMPVILVLYLVAAGAILAAYLMTSKYTVLGSSTARILGTVLSVIASVVVFMVWQTFAAVAWMPVDALWANHLGLMGIALHVLGSVLVWLPASNNFVRESAFRGSTSSVAWQNVANERQ